MESSDCSNSDGAITYGYGSKDSDGDPGYESGKSQGSMVDRYVNTSLMPLFAPYLYPVTN